NAPHDPRQSPARFVQMYPEDQIQLPENYQPEYPYKDGIGCSPELRDEFLAPFPRTEAAVRVHRQEYYAIISHLDEQVGRILQALDVTGKRDNTYIVFTADHGLAVGRHGLMGKQNMYDHSVRVPFAIVGPNIPVGEQRTAPIYLQDIVPTTMELAGIEIPGFVEFQTLLPLIRDETLPGRNEIYGAYLDKQRMVTAEGYKLIVYPEIKRVRLYHLDQDPLEQHDLAGRPELKDVTSRLIERLRRLQQECGDPMPLGDWLDG
ncbi:MAG: sulfatase-like hydrolase/transferase, partial [Planctomycetales bacterium]|nr:sulfatase-like hydrolase/transferase [Planctomycetales bacterium]